MIILLNGFFTNLVYDFWKNIKNKIIKYIILTLIVIVITLISITGHSLYEKLISSHTQNKVADPSTVFMLSAGDITQDENYYENSLNVISKCEEERKLKDSSKLKDYIENIEYQRDAVSSTNYEKNLKSLLNQYNTRDKKRDKKIEKSIEENFVNDIKCRESMTHRNKCMETFVLLGQQQRDFADFYINLNDTDNAWYYYVKSSQAFKNALFYDEKIENDFTRANIYYRLGGVYEALSQCYNGELSCKIELMHISVAYYKISSKQHNNDLSSKSLLYLGNILQSIGNTWETHADKRDYIYFNYAQEYYNSFLNHSKISGTLKNEAIDGIIESTQCLYNYASTHKNSQKLGLLAPEEYLKQIEFFKSLKQ